MCVCVCVCVIIKSLLIENIPIIFIVLMTAYRPLVSDMVKCIILI